MSNSTNINWKRTKFFFESKVFVPAFAEAVEVWADPEDDSPDSPSPAQLRALDAFLALGPEQKGDWTHLVALDCHYSCLQFEMDKDDLPVQLRGRADVWNHVQIGRITIPQHGTSVDRYVFVGCDCDWEEEHGLELLFKNERLFRVGRQEGLSGNEEWSLYFINE